MLRILLKMKGELQKVQRLKITHKLIGAQMAINKQRKITFEHQENGRNT